MNRIKQLREENSWTQLELAQKMNCAISSIAMYEKGARKPSMEVLIKMADIFNCTIDYLLCKTDVRNYDKEEQEFHFAYHKETEGLTDEEIADALRFYKEMKKKIGGNNGTK